MKNGFKTAILYIVIVVAIIVASTILWTSVPKDEMKYSDVVQLFKDEKVTAFEIDTDNKLTMDVVSRSQSGDEVITKMTYRLRSFELFINDLDETIMDQFERGIIKNFEYPAPAAIPAWLAYLPYIIVIALMIGLVVFAMRSFSSGKMGGGITSVGKSRAKLVVPDKNTVHFKDVAGADEEKAELEEIVEFLKDPSYFTKLGAKIPRGVLLVGRPGTGKTLIAKAVAGEAGVPFYSVSASDFVELYVGVGASRVRDLFDTARKHPASIIFIDEIDAVGRHRGAGLGGGHDEREQTLNQILVEMDGFQTSEGVIVMAATNRPDILDPALLRPGRFDRQVTMSVPDINGREEILKVHARNKPFEEDVDFSVIARSTPGFTGAELANLLNEAALLAARKGKYLIGTNDIEEALTKIIVGPAKRKRVVDDKAKKLTAYHEAGHAITGWACQPDNTVRQISIIPGRSTGGHTITLPKKDKDFLSKADMENEIVMCLGGRAAEKLILGDISTGASSDIQNATSIARSMVMTYGMSEELGPIKYGGDFSSDEVFLGRDFNNTKNYSEKTAAVIDDEIKNIMSEAYRKALKILEDNTERLHFVAGYLIEHEIMDEEQFARVMEDPEVTYEQLDEMVAEKRERSRLENEKREQHIREMEKKREEERKKAAEKREAPFGRPDFFSQREPQEPAEKPKDPEETETPDVPEKPEEKEDKDGDGQDRV